MKKVYEAPLAEITVLSSNEDILVASDVLVDVGDLFGAE